MKTLIFHNSSRVLMTQRHMRLDNRSSVDHILHTTREAKQVCQYVKKQVVPVEPPVSTSHWHRKLTPEV